MDMLLRSFKTNQDLDAQLGDNYADVYAVCGELCDYMSSRGPPAAAPARASTSIRRMAEPNTSGPV